MSDKTYCKNCGCSWPEDGYDPPPCPYCQGNELARLEHERNLLAREFERLLGAIRQVAHQNPDRVAMQVLINAVQFYESNASDELRDLLVRIEESGGE